MSEWIELFDGKTLSGWKGRMGGGRGGTEAPDHKWKVVGNLRLHPEDEKRLLGEPRDGVMMNGDAGGDLGGEHY